MAEEAAEDEMKANVAHVDEIDKNMKERDSDNE